MLKEAGVEYVIIGHSERRQYFGETDATVNSRLKAAVAAGLKPIVCIDNGKETGFAIKPYSPGENADLPGILYFGYGIQNSGAVERNNFGTELIVSTTVSGNGTIPLNCETVLGSWENEREVEETIGIPWLSEIPYLKYLFSTTVKNKERSLFFLTVTAKIPDTAVTEQTTHLRRGLKK